MMMKVSCSTIAASLLAASTAALSSSSHSNPNFQELRGKRGEESSLEKEKFAPRFDGLRFIETLVTAHK